MVERVQVHFAGRVQGVGFRFTTQQIAQRYPVQGFVRNLHDGQVLLVAEGTSSDLGRLLDDIRDSLGSYISRESVVHAPATGEFVDFCVRR